MGSYIFSVKRAARVSRPLLVGVSVVAILTASPAFAALGGDVASVQADQLHMQGVRRTTAAAAYTVHEIQAATGTVVREYVSSDGTVFAVTWQGPWPPDMHQLLGSYFDHYSQALTAQSGGRMARHPLVIEMPGLRVEVGGHNRFFTGRAYLPDRLPSNVKAEEVR
jgi:Protein of unknown function (DUF2844)